MRIRGQGGLLWRALPVVKIGYRLIGRSWIDFYAWMLNRQERKNTIGSLLSRQYSAPGRDKGLYDFSRGAYHASYLVRHGLKAHHHILDFGCGLGRTAVPLLRYLEPGRYVGLDISRERIRLARDYVTREGCDGAGAEFIVNVHNNFTAITSRRFDFVWAQSVFTHMPKSDVEAVLTNIGAVMSPRGIFMFNFNLGDADGAIVNVKDYFYSEAFFRRLAERNGFDLQVLNDWKDDLPIENRDKNSAMVKLTRLAA